MSAGQSSFGKVLRSKLILKRLASASLLPGAAINHQILFLILFSIAEKSMQKNLAPY